MKEGIPNSGNDERYEGGILPDLEPETEVSAAELALRARLIEEHEERMSQAMEFTPPKVTKDVGNEMLLSDGSKLERLSGDLKFAFVEGNKHVTPVEGILNIPQKAPELPKLSIEDKKDIEAIKDTEAVKEEISKMSEPEKQRLSIGLDNIGFYVEEKKNKFFAGAFEMVGTSKDTGDTLARWTNNMKSGFERDAELARKKFEDPNKGLGKKVTSSLSLIGNALKYGRTVADVLGATALSPLRYVMAGGMAFARGAEAAKETRFQNDEVLNQTREQDAEKAAETAWSLYERAGLSGAGKVSAEDLKTTYLKEMPKDLMERISNDPSTAETFVQKVLRKDLGFSINKLSKNLEKIDADNALSPEDKEMKKLALLRTQERNLRDYDRVIGKYGTVDALAMSARYAQTAGKAVVGVTMVETLALSVEKIWESLNGALSSVDAEGVSEIKKDEMSLVAARDMTRVAMPEYNNQSDSLDLGRGVNIPNEPPAIEMSNEEIARASESARESIPESIPDEVAIESIARGGSVSQAIHEMVDKGEISREDFLKAWNNPESLVDINGEKVHISKVGLVYEGNQVKFIPGENGAQGRFEVLRGEGKQFASDKELYVRYQELDKEAPDWLKRSLGLETGRESLALEDQKIFSDGAGDNSYSRNQVFEQGIDVSQYRESSEINPNQFVSLFPEAFDEAGYNDSFDDVETQYVVLERHLEGFADKSLAEQKDMLEDLAPVREYLRHASDAELGILPDEVRHRAEDMAAIIDSMEQELAETEQAFRDKLTLLNVGLRNYENYQSLIRNISVEDFILKNTGGASENGPGGKLVTWINELKPTRQELKLGVDAFLRSRFR